MTERDAAQRILDFDPVHAGEDWDDALCEDAVAVARAYLATADEIERLREALLDATAHLSGSASAYRKHAARSATLKPRAIADSLFSTRAKDFEKAAERASRACREDK